jgi:hypothetical protein
MGQHVFTMSKARETEREGETHTEDGNTTIGVPNISPDSRTLQYSYTHKTSGNSLLIYTMLKLFIVLFISVMMGHYHYTILTHRSVSTPGFRRLLLRCNRTRSPDHVQSSGAREKVSSGIYTPNHLGLPFGFLPYFPLSRIA